MLSRRTFALSLLSAAAAGPVKAQPKFADVGLILATDVSESVTAQSYALQVEGIQSAFRSSALHEALRHVSVAVNYMEWSSATANTTGIAQKAWGWRLIESARDAEAFAQSMGDVQRSGNGLTYIAEAMTYCGAMFANAPFEFGRRVIDISGDGEDNQNEGANLPSSRSALIDQGIVINGLPIRNSSQGDINAYYAAKVIGGPGSFIAPAQGFEDFARAMRRKLIIELG